MLDFGLDPAGTSKPALLKTLGEFLVEQRAGGRLALLVIDEAQNLSLPALEEIRMLSNLETEKSKLIQIILIGQPDLRDKLARPELEQLRQRITVSYHLRAARRRRDAPLHQPSAGARRDRRAARVSARRHRPDSPAQRRRAAHDQRDRRRHAAVRLRRGAQRDRRGADRGSASPSSTRPACSARGRTRTATSRSSPARSGDAHAGRCAERRWPPAAPAAAARAAGRRLEDQKLARRAGRPRAGAARSARPTCASRERELAEQRAACSPSSTGC